MKGPTAVLLAIWAAGSAGCGQVEACRRGEVGCAGGPVDQEQTCRFDLVARSGVCITPAEARMGGGQPQPNPCGPCPEGQTCASDRKQCVDFCVAPPALARVEPPVPIRCGSELKGAEASEVDALTFDQTCINTCELACRAQAWFCESGCEPDTCKQPKVLAQCHEHCDADTDPLGCVLAICSDTRATGCTGLQGFCPDGETPDCSMTKCSNTCATSAFDGVCDDGDLASASFASCAFGTDCADCGPRQGEDLSRELKQGERCTLQEQCAGSSFDFSKNATFCVTVSPGANFKRCVLDCSGEQERCPVGTTCTILETPDNAGKKQPVTDFQGVQARACLPDACE